MNPHTPTPQAKSPGLEIRVNRWAKWRDHFCKNL